MIRGNYSLAKEVRKNEQRHRQKIQQRQKHNTKLESLKDADPIRLYRQLERLEKEPDLDQYKKKRLARLREDWAFIVKNGLFKEKVDLFLANQKKVKAAEEKEQRRLRGKESIYFNAELNPLGKVPKAADGLPVYPNLAKPVHERVEYSPDPLVKELNIQPPAGMPPQFYKDVQNIDAPVLIAALASHKTKPVYEVKQTGLDSDSANELNSDF